jgi:thiamine-phosphate pyrophosphorylase
MQLVVLSAEHTVKDEATLINRLFEAGMEIFHLRKKAMDEQTLATLLEAIDNRYYPAIALHQHHRLAAVFGTRRLHFPVQQRLATSTAELHKLQTAGFLLSTSVHSIKALQQLPRVFAYTFLGPVFDSLSKQGYQGRFSENFCLHNEQKTTAVVALGGITAARIEQVRQMNFDGAAILGALWNNPAKAPEQFARLQQCVTQSPASRG